MILDEAEIKERMESPLNLLNRLKSISNNSDTKSRHPSIPPSSSEIIQNLEEKININSTKSRAISIMTEAMDELKRRLPEISKPKELSTIAESMSKIISNTQVKVEDNRKQAMVIIYSPQIVKEEAFDTIDIREDEKEIT